MLSAGRLRKHFQNISEGFENYIGIEPNAAQLDKIELPGFGSWLASRGVGEVLPIGESQVDSVLILSTRDHCVDDRAVLREVIRGLKPEGTVLI